MKRLYSILTKHWHLIAGMSALFVAGCAGVSYTSIPDAAADRTSRGFRYYDTSPYILVKTNNQGGLSSEIIYLPDTTKKRAARPYSFLAKNDTTLTFGAAGSEGLTLTSGSSDANAAEVPEAIAKALGDVAKQAATGGAFLKTSQVPKQTKEKVAEKAPTFALFKIVKQEGEWGLIGAQNNPVDYLP